MCFLPFSSTLYKECYQKQKQVYFKQVTVVHLCQIICQYTWLGSLPQCPITENLMFTQTKMQILVRKKRRPSIALPYEIKLFLGHFKTFLPSVKQGLQIRIYYPYVMGRPLGPYCINTTRYYTTTSTQYSNSQKLFFQIFLRLFMLCWGMKSFVTVWMCTIQCSKRPKKVLV